MNHTLKKSFVWIQLGTIGGVELLMKSKIVKQDEYEFVPEKQYIFDKREFTVRSEFKSQSNETVLTLLLRLIKHEFE